MIWHLLPLPRWQSAGSGVFVPGTEDAAPFVHASPDEPVTLAVANDRFTGSPEPLVALALDESRLAAPVRREPADPAPPPGTASGALFPHVYGPLGLIPHPEGGWFRETWRAEPSCTPAGYPGRRAAATAIYFLLPPGTESCWHTVRSDEVWLWHAGGPLTLLLGGTGPRPAAEPAVVTLGPDLAGGQRPQHLVRAGGWQSARPAGDREVLVSCVVAPGFDFADFTALPA